LSKVTFLYAYRGGFGSFTMLPLLAAVIEGLQQKAFLAFLYYFNLGWILPIMQNKIRVSTGLVKTKRPRTCRGLICFCRGTSALRGRSLFVDALAKRHSVEFSVSCLFFVQIGRQQPNDVVVAKLFCPSD
jgi:hypothetical protein